MNKKQYLSPCLYVYHAVAKGTLMLGSNTVTNDYTKGDGTGDESGDTPDIHNNPIEQGGGITPSNVWGGDWDNPTVDPWSDWDS